MSSVEGGAAAPSLLGVARGGSSLNDPNPSQAMVALQMDVGLVDSYLLRLLLPRFVSMMKHVQPAIGFSPDAMATLLHIVTVWFTSAQTPATKALGMQVRERREKQQSDGVTRYNMWKLIFLSLVMPTAYQQLVSWHERSSRSTATDRISQIALERKRKLAGSIIVAVQRVVPVLRVAALVSCLSGRSNAPGLSMCLVGLSFARGQEQQPPPLNATYAHRRWLYEELLSTLQSISPYSTSTFSSLNSWLVDSLPRLWKVRRNADDEARCAICGSNPISIPYITNCCHIYCYPCIWNAALDDPSFRCRKCSQVVSSSRPLETVSRGNKRNQDVANTGERHR